MEERVSLMELEEITKELTFIRQMLNGGRFEEDSEEQKYFKILTKEVDKRGFYIKFQFCAVLKSKNERRDDDNHYEVEIR